MKEEFPSDIQPVAGESSEINTGKLLAGLARKLETDPDSMAARVRSYGKQRQLTEAQICAELDIPPEMLVRLKICRAPEDNLSEPELKAQLDELAKYCGIKNKNVLRRIITGEIRVVYGKEDEIL